MIVDYLPVKAGAGHKKTFGELKLPALRRRLVKPVYRRARAFRWYREAVSSLYTYGYGLFRNYFLALGAQLAQRGALVSQDDVFYLYYDEVREIVRARDKSTQYQDLIEKRRREIDQVHDVELPSVIFGDREPAIQTPADDRLVGIPTSRGLHTGRVKVLRGLEEFDKLEVGDILVIPYSDVGWTPLFARAGAVVAESGGLLSHSSIVAREYGIPAVVSVPGACRLQDNSLVTVDGYQGEITVHDSPERQPTLRKG
jgi:pyruvate,water dikinase